MEPLSENQIFKNKLITASLGYIIIVSLLLIQSAPQEKTTYLTDTVMIKQDSVADAMENQKPTEEELFASVSEKITELAFVDENSSFTEAADTTDSGSLNNEPQTCQMSDWGVQFSCNIDGHTLTTDDPQNTPIILSENPSVTLNWKKFDDSIRFIGQLNKIFFEETGLYAEGFKTEPVDWAGHKAILVKGFSKETPDVQKRDYFYLHDNQLVGVSFTISPESKWEEGKAIIQKIKESLAAIH